MSRLRLKARGSIPPSSDYDGDQWTCPRCEATVYGNARCCRVQTDDAFAETDPGETAFDDEVTHDDFFSDGPTQEWFPNIVSGEIIV